LISFLQHRSVPQPGSAADRVPQVSEGGRRLEIELEILAFVVGRQISGRLVGDGWCSPP
jgi:hypothetical protein